VKAAKMPNNKASKLTVFCCIPMVSDANVYGAEAVATGQRMNPCMES